MDYYLIFGMVATGLGALIVLGQNILKVFKSITDPINELNMNIAKLGSSIDSMKERDLVRDKRIDHHGKEIDELKLDVKGHDIRIKQLEGKG